MEMLKALCAEKDGDEMPLPYRSADAAGVIWPNGSYQARIEKAEEARSNAGNDMLKLTVIVFAPDGQSRIVYDYIVLNNPVALQKLGRLADAIGKGDRYRADKLDVRDISGSIVSATLGLKVSKNPKYGDDNQVVAYSELDKLTITPRAEDEREPGDEDDWLTGD